MLKKALLPLLMSTLLLPSTAAHASFTLLGIGGLTGSAAGENADLSGLSGTLEDGLPANILGGLGSGFAHAGGNTFLALPDRGPNATPYNSAVDDTVSYIDRFHTLDIVLSPNGGPGLPLSVTTKMNATTLLSSPTPLVYGTGAGLGVGSGAPSQNTADTFYFSARSDNFDSGQTSGNPNNARLDPESIRMSNNGKSVFISDEYGPYVYQFDRATGKRIRSFTLPANLDVSNLSPQSAVEISGNTSGRVANKGMEGLALTPDGKTLVGIMQAPLVQDAADAATKKLLRIVTIDIATGTTHEFGYKLTDGSGVSDIIAVNDHEFLVDERDGKGLGDGSTAKVKELFKIDITGATDITNLTGTDAASAAVGKTQVLDLVQLLKDNGIGGDQIPSKVEGLAFGQDVTIGGTLEHTLYVSTDNDFLPRDEGPNTFYVLGFTDDDLPSFVAQDIPEPRTIALLLSGLLGLHLVRRRGSLTPRS